MLPTAFSDTPYCRGVPAGHPTSLGGCKPFKSRSPGDSLWPKLVGVQCSLAVLCNLLLFYFLVASTASDAGIAARALACIAEVLGCMAQGEGGLRSGPAANREWASAFGRLESGDIAGGVQELAAERQKWMSR